MIKICLSLCFLALTTAELQNYQPLHTLAQPITFAHHAPAPVYEHPPASIASQELRQRSLDGAEHTVFSKSLITPFSAVRKYDSRTTNTGFLTQSIPNIHAVPLQAANYIAHTQHSGQDITPFIHNLAPQQIDPKTISSNLVTPFNENRAVKTTITYSEAPSVSHMTFTGLGASYSW